MGGPLIELFDHHVACGSRLEAERITVEVCGLGGVAGHGHGELRPEAPERIGTIQRLGEGGTRLESPGHAAARRSAMI